MRLGVWRYFFSDGLLRQAQLGATELDQLLPAVPKGALRHPDLLAEPGHGHLRSRRRQDLPVQFRPIAPGEVMSIGIQN